MQVVHTWGRGLSVFGGGSDGVATVLEAVEPFDEGALLAKASGKSIRARKNG